MLTKFKKTTTSFLAISLCCASIFLASCGAAMPKDGDYNYIHADMEESLAVNDFASPGAGFYGSSTFDNGVAYESEPMEGFGNAYVEKPMSAQSQSMTNEIAEPEQSNRKIIYSGWAQVQTKEYDNSVALLMQLCEKHGAYFETSSSYGNRLDYQTERSSEYKIRIPVENYESFRSEVGAIGSVVQSGEDNSDVTEQYIDIEARLESAMIREERVLVLLENAANLDDVLALERELSDIRYEIESMTGSLRKLDSLVSFATYNLNITEVVEYQAPVTVPKTFSERLTQNFKDGWRDFVVFWQNVVIALSYNVFAIAVWVVVIVLALIVITSITKRNRKKKEKKRLEYIERANELNKASENSVKTVESTDNNKN